MSRAKTICTLGPSTDKLSVLSEMMRSGMDVARLNFSHGSLKEHLRRIHLVRNLDRKHVGKVKILGDLEGYRMRVGKLKGGKPIQLKKGEILWVTTDNILGSGNLLPFDYDGPLSRIKKGQHIFIDDGNIALVSEGHAKGRLKTRVLIPGDVKERKGVNMPSLAIDFVGLTEQDKEDIDFCAQCEVEYIAQSFVRTKEDILAIRE